MRFPAEIEELAYNVVTAYARKGKKIVTAESCTGGLIAGALTAIPGSSDVFERGFATYSYDSKSDVLGVLPETIKMCGAVSTQVAEAMAKGALEYSLADCAISVTGIAGPGGGTDQKPVGLVYFGLATKEGSLFHVQGNFSGDRNQVREQTVIEGLKILLSLVEEE